MVHLHVYAPVKCDDVPALLALASNSVSVYLLHSMLHSAIDTFVERID